MYLHVTRGHFVPEHLAAARALAQELLLPCLRAAAGCRDAWWLETAGDQGAVLLVVHCESVAIWQRLSASASLQAVEQLFAPYLAEAPDGGGLWM